MNSLLNPTTSGAKGLGGVTAHPNRLRSHVVIRAPRSISSYIPRGRAVCMLGPAVNPEEFSTPVWCGSRNDTKGCGTQTRELLEGGKILTYGHSGSWVLPCGKPGRAY